MQRGLGPATVKWSTLTEKDAGGFARQAAVLEKYEEKKWWATDMLPAPLRHNSGHEGSHTFLTHEFADAVLNQRKPVVDVYTAVNIQHIESLNDVVAQITHVRVRETVPDSVFDRADALELVDLTPDDLIQRITVDNPLATFPRLREQLS